MQDATASVIVVTAPALDVAEALVTRVVEERLAACGNIVQGVVSIYRWQDAVQRDGEVLILFKTAAAMAERLMARIVELHPYDVPEAIELPVTRGSAPYLAWVVANADGFSG